MRPLKITLILAASLILTVLMGLAGCGDDHGHRVRGDRDRYERHDGDRHEDRGGDSDHDRGEHGGR